MNPNGLVLAASITSQTSTSSRWLIRANSLTSPIFTARNVFSSSFTISATRGDDTGNDGIDHLLVQRLRHGGRVGIDATHDLGNVGGGPLGVARIHALGRKREKEIVAAP